jgi:hypothetical protein
LASYRLARKFDQKPIIIATHGITHLDCSIIDRPTVNYQVLLAAVGRLDRHERFTWVLPLSQNLNPDMRHRDLSRFGVGGSSTIAASFVNLANQQHVKKKIS